MKKLLIICLTASATAFVSCTHYYGFDSHREGKKGIAPADTSASISNNVNTTVAKTH